MAEDGVKMAQDGAKMAKDGHKMAQDGPRWSQTDAQRGQDGPRAPWWRERGEKEEQGRRGSDEARTENLYIYKKIKLPINRFSGPILLSIEYEY